MRTMGLLLSTEACQQEKLRSKTSLPMAQCERPAGTARCSRGFSRTLKSQVCGRDNPHYARPETALLVTEVCDTVTRRHYPSPPPPPRSPPSAGTSTAGSYTLSHQSKSRRRNARVFGADLAGKDSGYAVRAVGAHQWDQHGDRIKQVHGMRKCMRMSMWRVRM